MLESIRMCFFHIVESYLSSQHIRFSTFKDLLTLFLSRAEIQSRRNASILLAMSTEREINRGNFQLTSVGITILSVLADAMPARC